MIGCPNGIHDAVNAIPIVRRGITATPYSSNYSGKEDFMIDIACFQGSSGSPIFMSSQYKFDRSKNLTEIGASRFHLLGVLYQGPLQQVTGEIVLSKNPMFQFSSMLHLGIALKASRILELEDYISQRLGFTLS